MEKTQEIAELPEALKKVLANLTANVGRKILATETFRGELTFIVPPEEWVPFLTYCREDPALQFDRLDCLLGNHFPERAEAPFEVVAHLTSLPNNLRVRVKTRLAEGQKLQTARGVWPSADWDERETWEMFGIEFEGHPDLRRLLTIPDFKGYPLRKDFPLEGTVGGKIRVDLKGKL